MSPESFRFDVGGFGCVCVSDGAFNYPLESFFANVPRERVEEALRQGELSIRESVVRSSTGDHWGQHLPQPRATLRRR